MVTITGNTYPVKEQLKALGGRWNSEKKGWDVPEDKANEAYKLVESGRTSPPVRSGNHRRFTCEDCGDVVWSGSRCWETGLKH